MSLIFNHKDMSWFQKWFEMTKIKFKNGHPLLGPWFRDANSGMGGSEQYVLLLLSILCAVTINFHFENFHFD